MFLKSGHGNQGWGCTRGRRRRQGRGETGGGLLYKKCLSLSHRCIQINQKTVIIMVTVSIRSGKVTSADRSNPVYGAVTWGCTWPPSCWNKQLWVCFQLSLWVCVEKRSNRDGGPKYLLPPNYAEYSKHTKKIQYTFLDVEVPCGYHIPQLCAMFSLV